MRFAQLSLLLGACAVGWAVSRSGWLASFCDEWLQSALPTLALLAVAAQLSQLGVKVDLQRHKSNRKQGNRKRGNRKRNTPDRTGPSHRAKSPDDEWLDTDQVLNGYLAHRYSPGILQAVWDFVGSLRLAKVPPYVRRNTLRVGICVPWSFFGFVLPVLTATAMLFMLVATRVVSTAKWSQFAALWGVSVMCIPPLTRFLPGKHDADTWKKWEKEKLIQPEQLKAILANRDRFNSRHTMFTPQHESSWVLRKQKTAEFLSIDRVTVKTANPNVNFEDYDTLIACWFFPGVSMDIYVAKKYEQDTAAKLTKSPLSCRTAARFRTDPVRSADFVVGTHDPCQLEFFASSR